MIAARYDVDLFTIFYLNGFDENVLLHPGDEVRVRLAPGEDPPPTPTPKLHHVVREGDTLWTVAALHSLTLDELLALNGLTTDAVLQVGDQLLIREMPTPRRNWSQRHRHLKRSRRRQPRRPRQQDRSGPVVTRSGWGPGFTHAYTGAFLNARRRSRRR